ncbi:hypothetical protein Syun_008248 [Stephania yunnanensis]|uniref:Uncharacterized protein n=1 Tax=Stephania yunnanensis TaxID=152371 RepID=A0AAP0KEA8_9MAGN
MIHVHRVVAPVRGQVPLVLSVGRVRREEDRDATRQHGVEGGAASEGVAGSLQAEAGAAHHLMDDGGWIVALSRPRSPALEQPAPPRFPALTDDLVTDGRLLHPGAWGPREGEEVGPADAPHSVLPRHQLIPPERVEVGRVGDPSLVVALPGVPLHAQHRHVLDRGQIEKAIGAEVSSWVVVSPHEVPSGPAQG